jgi:hypothetical protein
MVIEGGYRGDVIYFVVIVSRVKRYCQGFVG